MKYTLIAEDEFGNSSTTREFNVDYLPDVLSEVELFLKGAGFVFNGNLDFVNDFEEVPEDFTGYDHGCGSTMADYPELYDEQDLLKTKSAHYFDTQRNK
jgi:hypothetical protein